MTGSAHTFPRTSATRLRHVADAIAALLLFRMFVPLMAIARHGIAAATVRNRFYPVGDVQSSGTGVDVSTPVVSMFEFSRLRVSTQKLY